MKRTKLLAFGAVFTALISSLCCLPALVFLIFGASSALLAVFAKLESVRWILAGLSLLTLFLWIRARSGCACVAKTKENLLIVAVAFIVLFAIFYPEIIPLFLED